MLLRGVILGSLFNLRVLVFFVKERVINNICVSFFMMSEGDIKLREIYFDIFGKFVIFNWGRLLKLFFKNIF